MQRVLGWERPHWVEGEGAPYIAWFIPGKFDLAARRGVSGLGADLPPGVTATLVVRGEEDYPAFLWRGLLGRLLEDDYPEEAPDLAAAPEVVCIEGIVGDGASLDYLRVTIDVVASVLKAGGLGVCDPIAFKWWSQQAFIAQLVRPARPMPFQQVSILQSPEAGSARGTTWFYTRGMRIFGRPDISVRQVQPREHGAVVEVLNRLIATSALGAVVPEGHHFPMPGHGVMWVARHGGDLDDPTFNNAHVALIRA